MRRIGIVPCLLSVALLASPALPQNRAAAQARADRHVYTSDLTTRWGRQVTPATAWRSYPRPQMERSRWVNLNGEWDYAIRPAEQTEPHTMDGKILVPFAPESKLSGVARSVLPSDRLWYHRRFTVPSDWAGQHEILHFGAVDYKAYVSVNGAMVGAHEGGSDSFSFDITPYLKAGANDLVVQVTDPTSNGAQPRGKQQLNPKGIWYTPVSGIWQTVWMEPVPALHIEDMKITPDIDRGELRVVVALNRSAEDDDAIRITALHEGKTVARVLSRANRPASLAVPDAHLWSPDDPFLYDLKVELVKVRNPYADLPKLRKGERWSELMTDIESARYAKAAVTGSPSDSVSSYFAMRKISVGPGKIPGQPALLLNNKPLFQNGTLDQGWWPDGLLTPPSEAAVDWELGWLKRAGFNMVRKHIKVEPAQYYAAADHLGVLIWQDMPSGEEAESKDQFVRQSADFEAVMPQAVENEFQAEFARIIAQLRNHPSIVTWVVNNEGWGQFGSTRIGHIVKDLDPSRVVDKVSGWRDTGDDGSDIYDIHTYEAVPRTADPHAGRAIVIGEFGGIGDPVPGHLWFQAKRNWGYQRAADTADYEKRYRTKFDEIIRQARTVGLSASIYTQTSDVEGEVNGLLTYDRAESKLPAETYRAISAPLLDKED